MTFLRQFRLDLADALSDWAQRRRDVDFTHRAAWEAETEPGYKMGGFNEAASDLSTAIADLQDALADQFRPTA